MKVAEILKKRDGFTLAELSVVMAVSAIIGTMVVTFMMFATRQQAEITKEAKCIGEITEVQKSVNTWLKKYDNENHTITSPGNTKLVATTTASVKAGEITFSNKKIKVDSTAVSEELENITSVAFYVLSGKNAIRVRVSYGNNETQDLIFSQFSNVTRIRRVENRS